MDIEVIELEAQQVAFIRRVLPVDDLKGFFDTAFGSVVAAVTTNGGSIVGPPFGWYHGMPTETVDVAAGFPVTGMPAGQVAGTDVTVEARPACRAVVAMHVGPYEGLAESYGNVMKWMQEQDLEPQDSMWEEYLTDPSAEPDQSKWQTRLVLPVR